MWRWIKSILCGFSALIALVTVAMWIHGAGKWTTLRASRTEPVGKAYLYKLRAITWFSGDVVFFRQDLTVRDPNAIWELINESGRGWISRLDSGTQLPFNKTQFGNAFLGAQIHSRTFSQPELTGTDTVVLIPCWWIVLATSILPLTFLIVYFRRRVRPGCCETCGYATTSAPRRSAAPNAAPCRRRGP
jgi:hypothetical protein